MLGLISRIDRVLSRTYTAATVEPKEVDLLSLGGPASVREPGPASSAAFSVCLWFCLAFHSSGAQLSLEV